MTASKVPLLPGATRDLANFSSNLQFQNIPIEVIERIKLSVLDTIGACVHGSTLPWTKIVRSIVETEGAKPVASIFGCGRKTSIAGAVLVNSTAGHAFELDDIHKESIIHPGSLAIPVAIALGEANGKTSGKSFLTAIVSGYEVGARVGNAATVSLLINGWHPQGTTGAFTAAATAARMLELDAEKTLHTFGIVGSLAGGLMASQEGAMVKRFHSGRAGQSGVYAAQLASHGFTGITDVLEAAYGGYLVTHSSKPVAEKLIAGLCTTWETLNVGYKTYAAVTSIHAALDALLIIRHEKNLSTDDIIQVDAEVSKATYVHCAWEYKAQGVTAAQMNIYYGLSMIAIDGAAFIDQYREERLRDPRVLGFIPRIRVRISPIIEGMGPEFRHAARITVKTRDGHTYQHECLVRRGSAENPIKRSEIITKFFDITRSNMAPADSKRMIELIDSIEELESIDELIRIAVAPTKP